MFCGRLMKWLDHDAVFITMILPFWKVDINLTGRCINFSLHIGDTTIVLIGYNSSVSFLSNRFTEQTCLRLSPRQRR